MSEATASSADVRAVGTHSARYNCLPAFYSGLLGYAGLGVRRSWGTTWTPAARAAATSARGGTALLPDRSTLRLAFFHIRTEWTAGARGLRSGWAPDRDQRGAFRKNLSMSSWPPSSLALCGSGALSPRPRRHGGKEADGGQTAGEKKGENAAAREKEREREGK